MVLEKLMSLFNLIILIFIKKYSHVIDLKKIHPFLFSENISILGLKEAT